MKKILLLSLALAGALPTLARGEERGGAGRDCCACEGRCERRRDRLPRFEGREDVERLHRLRELRRRREGLERVLRHFDRNGDGRLDEAERRRIREIRELRERRQERRRESGEPMRGLRERAGAPSPEPGRNDRPGRAGCVF